MLQLLLLGLKFFFKCFVLFILLLAFIFKILQIVVLSPFKAIDFNSKLLVLFGHLLDDFDNFGGSLVVGYHCGDLFVHVFDD